MTRKVSFYKSMANEADFSIRYEKVTVKSRSLYAFLVLLIFSSLGLSSCQAVKNVQAQPDEIEFIPTSLVARDCKNGNLIRAIRAVDEYTVKFELCSPDRTFAAKVGVPAFSLQDDNVLSETQGDPAKISSLANGTGPYKVSKVDKDHFSLESRPNLDYWGLPVRLRSINFSWNADSKIRVMNLISQTVDGISAVAPADIEANLSNENFVVKEAPLIGTVFLGMNNIVSPFDSQPVRQAIAYSIDRQNIAENYFNASAQAAEQLVPPSFSLGHSSSLTWYDYKSAQAADILRQSNFDFDQVLTLSYDETPSSMIPKPTELAAELAQKLNDVGIKVSLNPMQTAEFQKRLLNGKLGFYFTFFKPDYPDANSFFETLLSQDSSFFGKIDSTVTDEIQKSLATGDQTAIQASYDAINIWLQQQVPLIPLVYTNETYGFLSEVENIRSGYFSEDFPEMISPSQNLAFMQFSAPGLIWPVDYSQEDTLRITRLVFDTLTTFDLVKMSPKPSVAESWSSNDDFTEWTFNLRYDVEFSNGDLLDANDVVATFAAQADLSNPNHSKEYSYDYYQRIFGNFINQP